MKRNFTFMLLAALLIPAAGVLAAEDESPGPMIEITGDRFTIPVPDLQISARMGRPLRLYQEHTNAYVTKVEKPDGSHALCAFPKFDKKGRATAWITKDKSVFFGMDVVSMPAEFMLETGENLPVVGQTSRDWMVTLERYGDQLTIRLPKDRPGLLYKKPVIAAKREPTQQEKLEEELRKYLNPPEPTQEVAQAKEPKRRSFFGRKSANEDEQPAKGRKIVIAKGEDNELTAEIDGQKLDDTAPKEEEPQEDEAGDEKIVPEDDATSATEQVTAETEPVVDEEQPAAPRFKVDLMGMVQWIAAGVLGAGLLAAIGIKIVRKKKASGFKLPDLNIKKEKAARAAEKKEAPKEKAPEPAPAAPEKKKEPEAAGLSDASVYFRGLADSKADFSGSLASFSLLDLIQFLNSTKETGDLQIRDDAGEKTAELFFAKGEIIDASHGAARGVAAIFSLAKNAKGSFAFVRNESSGAKRTIEMPTMSLLLEASKHMDEGPAAAPAPKPEPKPKPKPLSLKKK